MLKDHLGSASVVTDANGDVVGEQRYYAFGETRFTSGSMFTDKLYTSQREITGLGIYHYGARFYSPKLGRFLSADTMVPNAANPQDFNRYSYVRNNPVRYIDPTGHMCTDPEDPTPTCYGSGTTRVGNRMIQGNQAELGAAKNLLKVVKKTKGEGGGGGTVTTTTSSGGGTPTVTDTQTPTPWPTTTPSTPTITVTASRTPTLWPSATPVTPTITPTPTYNVPWPGRGPDWCRFDSVCWAEAAGALDPPGGAGSGPSYNR